MLQIPGLVPPCMYPRYRLQLLAHLAWLQYIPQSLLGTIMGGGLRLTFFILFHQNCWGRKVSVFQPITHWERLGGQGLCDFFVIWQSLPGTIRLVFCQDFVMSQPCGPVNTEVESILMAADYQIGQQTAA